MTSTTLPLWAGPAPLQLGTAENDVPTLTPYLVPEGAAHSAIVVCPGGGYGGLAIDHEGHHIARWFQARGTAALVLKYRLPAHGYRHPVPLLDVQRALRVVRSHAKEWNIDPAKIGLMGFSAGGHLASTLITHFDAGDAAATDPIDRVSCRPDFAALIYPVISMKEGITHQGSKNNLLGPDPDPALVANLSNETQVTPQTPPTILVHAVDDKGVIVDNSRLMLAALQQAGVLSQLDEYPLGGHGFGFWPDKPNANTDAWLPGVHTWLQANGFVA